MNKRRILLAAGCTVLILFALISCKTPPEADAPDEGDQTAVTEDLELKELDAALADLVDRMETLRASCTTYKLGSYYPEDWQKAEELRGAALAAVARVAKTSSDGKVTYLSASDYTLATESCTQAIPMYEKILDGGIALLSRDMAAEMAREREAAIAAGARKFYPEQFNQAEEAEKKALQLYDADDVDGSYNEAQRALLRYKALQRAMEALSLKKTIDENDFARYDTDSYELAGTRFNDAVAAYGSEDAAALEAVESSVLLYRKVVNAGYKVLSVDMRDKAVQIRDLCDSIKASRSMKNEYSGALGTFVRADAFGKADEWESAYNGYSDAAVLFTDVYQQATLKKNAADAAIEAAKARQEYSSELAKKADEIAPLPEGAEGFSEEEPEQDMSSDDDAVESVPEDTEDVNESGIVSDSDNGVMESNEIEESGEEE